MKLLLCLISALTLVACASKPRYQSYSTPTYSAPARTYSTPTYSYTNQNIYQRPAQRVISTTPARPITSPPIAVSNFERLSYEDLVRFEPNCEKRTEQVALLEEQLKRNRFYMVSGVEGNSYPDKISKSYYSLAKYRIWSLRFACQGTEVSREVIKADLQAVPNAAPQSTPRCYFEEITEAKIAVKQVGYRNSDLSNDQTSTRREICTNFPYVADKPFIRVGEHISFTPKEMSDGQAKSSLRRWRGNIYQLASKTEIHQNQAVRFTLVAVRSGINQWTVVDKF
ncbi:hypothetical protein [Polynucleobacter antarcticus]|uniref:Lipoprotein n=1 Tax=Polynucleobacter antarcticus TaxID=1743162 RepID=A0A6M9PUX3_9BURK|nr:hypothetical protein [Polynucleobacter antarcticus]QKM62707.1 hypothetical protein DCO16_06335 [Polynucleobacter antarcticus]